MGVVQYIPICFRMQVINNSHTHKTQTKYVPQPWYSFYSVFCSCLSQLFSLSYNALTHLHKTDGSGDLHRTVTTTERIQTRTLRYPTIQYGFLPACHADT